MTNFFDNPGAFEAFMEPLLFRQQRKPHETFVVQGCVFHGRKEIEAYNTVSAGVVKRYSDTWTVTVPTKYGRVAEFQKADTLTRQNYKEEVLTVQSVIKEEEEWIISCTSSQKMG